MSNSGQRDLRFEQSRWLDLSLWRLSHLLLTKAAWSSVRISLWATSKADCGALVGYLESVAIAEPAPTAFAFQITRAPAAHKSTRLKVAAIFVRLMPNVALEEAASASSTGCGENTGVCVYTGDPICANTLQAGRMFRRGPVKRYGLALTIGGLRAVGN